MYVSKFFDVREFVPPEIYASTKIDPWWVMDERIVRIADGLRGIYGPATINDWHVGGKLKYCGFRPANTPDWTGTSQHDFGRAVDLHFINVDAEMVRNGIFKNPTHDAFKDITGIELGVSWVHVDIRMRTVPGILTFTA